MRLLKTMPFAGLVFLLAMPVCVAGDAPDWADFSGSWRGKGMLSEGPTGDLERGVCKFTNTITSDGLKLIMKGRCANAARTVAITTVLEATPSSNRIVATTRSRALPGPVALTGSASGDRIELSSNQPVEIEQRTYAVQTWINLEPNKTALTMVQSLSDTQSGVKSERLRMTFKRLD